MVGAPNRLAFLPNVRLPDTGTAAGKPWAVIPLAGRFRFTGRRTVGTGLARNDALILPQVPCAFHDQHDGSSPIAHPGTPPRGGLRPAYLGETRRLGMNGGGWHGPCIPRRIGTTWSTAVWEQNRSLEKRYRSPTKHSLPRRGTALGSAPGWSPERLRRTREAVSARRPGLVPAKGTARPRR